MAFVAFDGELDAPVKPTFTPFDGKLDSEKPSLISSTIDTIGSGMNAVHDWATRSTPDQPAAPTAVAGAGRGSVNPSLADGGAPPSSGSTWNDVGTNLLVAGPALVAKSLSTFAGIAGADDVAQSLKASQEYWDGIAREHGSETTIGRAANIVGSVLPAIVAAPEALAGQLAMNAGLFGIPAFKESLQNHLDRDESYGSAVAHAAVDFTVNMAMPVLAGTGGALVGKALVPAGAGVLKRVAIEIPGAGAVFGGLDAAGQVLDKGIDTAIGNENNAPWIDPGRVASSVIAGSAMHVLPMVKPAAGLATDSALSRVAPNYQAAREMSRTMDAGDLAPAVVETLNPNLRKTPSSDSIARVMATDSVDSAISAAQDSLRTPSVLDVNDKSYLAGQAQQDISDLNAKESASSPSQTLTPDEIAHRSYLTDAINPATDNGQGGLGTNYDAIARKLGYTPGDAAAMTPTLEQQLAALQEKKNGPTNRVIHEPDGTGNVPSINPGEGVEDGGRLLDDASRRNANPSETAAADSRAAVVARPTSADTSAVVSSDGLPAATGTPIEAAGVDARDYGDSLPPMKALKLQEAHRALGRGVTLQQVQSMRDRVAGEIDSGKTNNGGVLSNLKPAAIAQRKEQLARLDHDLSLFKQNQPLAPVAIAPAAIESVAPSKDQHLIPVSQRATLTSAPVGLSVGRIPNSAEPVMVKDGVVHIGKYPAQNFETGRDVTVADGASYEQIAAALKDAGALGNKTRIFGLEPTKPTLAELAIPVSKRITPEVVAPAQPDLGHIGRNNTPLIDGGQPFKTAAEADKARKQQPMLRRITVDSGFVLAPKTEKQIAAQEAAANRLSIARTGQPGVPMAAHEFIAGEGGLSPALRSDLGIEGNPRIGNRRLYARAGSGLTLEQATGKLLQDGYLREGQSQNEALALIKRSLTKPQYTPDGTERMAEAQRAADFQDHLEAQKEHPSDDPFAPLLEHEYKPEDAMGTGFQDASPEIKGEVAALSSLLDSIGIDSETIRMDIAAKHPRATDQEYHELTKTAIQSAIEEAAVARIHSDSGKDYGEQGQARSQEGLTSPTRADVLSQQERAANASNLDDKAQIDNEASRQTLTQQTEPEQRWDTSGDMFAQEKAQAEIDKRNAGVQAAKDPNQAGMFDKPSDPVTETKATLDANNVTGKERLDVIKDVKSGALTVAEVQEAYPAKIEDVGEKIGGARKDTAVSTGEKRKTKAQDDGRPTWAKRFQIGQIAGGFDISHNGRDITGKWTISDTRNKDRFDQPKQIGGYFDSKEAAEAALPLLTVAQKHRVISVRAEAIAPTEASVDAQLAKDMADKAADDNAPGKIEAMVVNTAKNRLAAGKIDQDAYDRIQAQYGKAADQYTPPKPVIEVEKSGTAYEIWRDINDRKRVKVIDQTFPTREDAMRYMAEHAKDIIETNTTFGEADLPRPENTDRTGVERRTGDVQGKDFQDEFGMRGVEFGNWNNQDERQQVMNAAYDGLHDLADVMGIPPKAIGLNGDLALAFGARGQGLNSAVAHYERNRSVINLTKMNGAGALAHEWFHGLDHYFGRQDGKANANWIINPDGTKSFGVKGAENDMASGGFGYKSGVREEVRDAYKTLIQTLFTKAAHYVEDTQKADKFVGRAREDMAKRLDDLRKDLSEQKDIRYYKRNNKPASAEQLMEFDTVAQALLDGNRNELTTAYRATDPDRAARMGLSGRFTNDSLDKISAIYKAVRGRSGFGSATDRNGVMDHLRSEMSRYGERLKMLADAQNATTKTKQTPTNFAMDAKSLDQGRGGDYWTTPHEMAARAFQGYVEDMIAAKGGKSPFLNHAPENAGILTPWGAKRPYPAGEERVAMNKAFDAFVKTIQTRETEHGTAIFSRSEESPIQRVPESGGSMPSQEGDHPSPAVRNPSTIERVQSAVTDFIGGKQLPNKLGRVVATTASEIKSYWEPLIDKHVNIGSEGDAGVAQAFYDPKTKTVFLIADHISQGNETAVLAHELMHKHGQAVLGKEGWARLHGVISTWEHADKESPEYAVYSYARGKVAAVGEHLSSQELFPYAVESALKIGIKPSMAAKQGTVARWLESVRQNMQQVWGKITGKPETFKTQDLVDLAFGIVQRENPEHATAIGQMKDARAHQTETQEFKNWFLNSKVVDSEGKPLVVYHGTKRGDISEFSNKAERNVMAFSDAKGHYFTSDPVVASNYAEGKYGGKSDGNPAVMPVYLSLKNPKIIDINSFEHTYVSPSDKLKLKSEGYDGLIYRDKYDRRDDEYIAFKSEQIKSSTGNNGNFDGTNTDIRFSMEKPENTREMLHSVMEEALRATAPIGVAPSEARASIKQYSNDRRLAQYRFGETDEFLKKNFTEAQQEKMWQAADEENNLRRTAASPSQMVGKGLDSLNPAERAAVMDLHNAGNDLFARAKAVGLISGDGVPFWTPRMMVMVDPQTGEFSAPISSAKGMGQDSLRLSTTAASAKFRKYDYSADTQAAMQAKGGDLVKNIRAMPMAMSRLESAIAGRELVNEIKTLGKNIGQEWISSSAKDDFVVANHPAFSVVRPRFEADSSGNPILDQFGHMIPKYDAEGNPIMDRQHLYVRRDIDAALRAALSSSDGKVYTGLMLLKSKAMSGIMISPLIHNMVIAGKALAMHPTNLPMIYARGYLARKNPALVEGAIHNGLVLLAQHNTAMDVTDLTNPIGKEGGLGDINESWLAHGARAAVGLVNKNAGEQVKAGIDKAGDFWHGTLLWNRIADLQMGLYQDAQAGLIKKGYTERAAGLIAAHIANRYGGALPKENMSEMSRKFANITLFSRSFTLGNIGIMKDVATGLPSGEKALLQREMGSDAGTAINTMRKKAFKGLVVDAAFAAVALSMFQDLLDPKNKNRPFSDVMGDYSDRAGVMLKNLMENPGHPGSYNPLRLFSQYNNEPGKQARAFAGVGDDGKGLYIRLPTGKVIEELFGWTIHPSETLAAKLSPTVKSIYQAGVNDSGFGHPVYNETDNIAKIALDIAAHIVKSHFASDMATRLYDYANGTATDKDKLALQGAMTGLTPSTGYPGGPESGVISKSERDYKMTTDIAKVKALRELKNGDNDAAEKLLSDAGMMPREISAVIRKYENPKIGTSKSANKWFNSHSSDTQKAQRESVNQ